MFFLCWLCVGFCLVSFANSRPALAFVLFGLRCCICCGWCCCLFLFLPQAKVLPACSIALPGVALPGTTLPGIALPGIARSPLLSPTSSTLCSPPPSPPLRSTRVPWRGGKEKKRAQPFAVAVHVGCPCPLSPPSSHPRRNLRLRPCPSLPLSLSLSLSLSPLSSSPALQYPSSHIFTFIPQ